MMYLLCILACMPGCHENAACKRNPKTLQYGCRCNAGFFGNGFSCDSKFSFLYIIIFILEYLQATLTCLYTSITD